MNKRRMIETWAHNDDSKSECWRRQLNATIETLAIALFNEWAPIKAIKVSWLSLPHETRTMWRNIALGLEEFPEP